MNINTDGLRVKTLSKKNGEGSITYPIGTDSIYVDMLSGLDLQEQLILNNNAYTVTSSVTYNDTNTTIKEIFQMQRNQQLEQVYKKETTIDSNTMQFSLFITNHVAEGEEQDYIIIQDVPEGYENLTTFLGIDYTAEGLGDIEEILFRKENNEWVKIHGKRTKFTTDLQGNVLTVQEMLDDSLINGTEGEGE